MPRRKYISNDLREAIVASHQSGKGYKTFSKLFGIYHSTQINFRLDFSQVLCKDSDSICILFSQQWKSQQLWGKIPSQSEPLLSTKNMAAQLRFAKLQLNKAQDFWNNVSVGQTRPKWRCLIVMHSSMSKENQTQHISAHTSHQLSSMVVEG